MLNALRRSAGSWLAKLLFILLVVSFAIWGVGDFLGPSAGTTVATVGDTEISDQEYMAEFNRQLESLRQRFGSQLDRETAIGLGLADQVLSRLVSRRLLALEAEELDIRVSDDLVRRRILEEEAFQGPTGRFDRQQFEQLLFANGLTEEGYVQRLRNELARGEAITAVARGGTAPTVMAEILYKHRAEERLAQLLFMPITRVGIVPEPDDAALAAYYEENKSEFEQPEFREVTALVLSPEDLAENIAIAEERIRDAYEARINEFRVPEKRQVSQLLFSKENEEAARAAAERLSTGGSFAEVAEEAAAAGAERTEIGEVRRGDLFPAVVEEAAFGLEQPGATEPIESPLGWHILNVTEIEPGSTTPFEEVAARIKLDLARDEAVEHVYELGTQVQDELAAGRSLEEIAESLNLRLVKIPALSREGRAPDGSELPGLPQGGFLDEAFSTPAGEESLLEETADGGYYVLRVDSVIPPRVPPLEEVRDRVASAWREQRLAELAAEEAERIAADLQAGSTFEALAAETGLEHRTSPAFTRDANRPGDWLPGPLVARLFQATPEGVVVQRFGDGFFIAQVAEVRQADPSANAETVGGLREELEQSIRADLEIQYNEALRERFGVEVREDVLRRLLL